MGNVLQKQVHTSKTAGELSTGGCSGGIVSSVTEVAAPKAPPVYADYSDSDGFETANDETICLDSSSDDVVDVTSEVLSGSPSVASDNGITSLTPILAHLDALVVADVCKAKGKDEACVSDLLGMMEKSYNWDDEVFEVPVTNNRLNAGALFTRGGGAGSPRGLKRPMRFAGMGGGPSKKVNLPIKGPMKGPVVRFKAPRTQLVPPRSTPTTGSSQALVCTSPVFKTGTSSGSIRSGPNPFVLLKRLNLCDLDANRVGRVKPKDIPSIERQRRLISFDGKLGLAKGNDDSLEDGGGEDKIRATNRKIIREYGLVKIGEKRANSDAAKVPSSSIATDEDDPAYGIAGKKSKLVSLVKDGQRPLAVSRSYLPGEMEVAIYNPRGEYSSTYEYLTARGWKMKVMVSACQRP